MKTLPRGGAARGREAATYGMETTLYNLPKMTDNEKTWAEFKLDIPEYYNFGYDVVLATTWSKGALRRRTRRPSYSLSAAVKRSNSIASAT